MFRIATAYASAKTRFLSGRGQASSSTALPRDRRPLWSATGCPALVPAGERGDQPGQPIPDVPPAERPAHPAEWTGAKARPLPLHLPGDRGDEIPVIPSQGESLMRRILSAGSRMFPHLNSGPDEGALWAVKTSGSRAHQPSTEVDQQAREPAKASAELHEGSCEKTNICETKAAVSISDRIGNFWRLLCRRNKVFPRTEGHRVPGPRDQSATRDDLPSPANRDSAINVATRSSDHSSTSDSTANSDSDELSLSQEGDARCSNISESSLQDAGDPTPKTSSLSISSADTSTISSEEEEQGRGEEDGATPSATSTSASLSKCSTPAGGMAPSCGGRVLAVRARLDVEPAVLARQMLASSSWQRVRLIRDLTAHLKMRVDLQTVVDVSGNLELYSSDEAREIEENARRAEALLSQVKVLLRRAGERKPSSIADRDSLAKCAATSGPSSGTIAVADGVRPRPSVHRTASRPPSRKASPGSQGQPRPVAPCCHPTRSVDRPTVLPAAHPRNRTFGKSAQRPAVSATPAAAAAASAQPTPDRDLTALGLPVIEEDDMEPVEDRKGEAIKLGSGDYGEVRLMRSTRDGGLMAVKRLIDLPNKAANDRRTDNMVREIRALESVRDCRFYPRFLGLVDRHSFAQEFVGHRRRLTSWSSHCLLYHLHPRAPRLLPLDWVGLCRDVTEGLAALHRAGWTHNDLHVGNVMVWHDPARLTWRARIIDLGKASRVDDPPPPRSLSESARRFALEHCTQMAPEIVLGTSRYCVQSDVYSLGVFLKDIAAQNRLLAGFRAIGDRCTVGEPGLRPALAAVLEALALECDKIVIPRRAARTKAVR